MDKFEYNHPTPEEIQAIMARAQQMRAEAMRDAAVAAAVFVKTQVQRLAHSVWHPRHA